MARDDDDDAVSDRPRPKRRKDREDDEAEDRPRKKTKSRDAEDDEDDDDRPRKKSRSRDDDDDDDDDDRRGKKKKKQGTPGLLLACSIVSLSCGGVCMLMNCGMSIGNTVDWVQIIRHRVFGMLPGSFKFLLIYMSVSNVLTSLAAIALVAAGILLMLRKGSGKIPAMGAPIALFVLPILDIILSSAIIGRVDHFRWWLITMLILTIVMGLGAGICNFICLFNQGVNKALR